MGKTRIKALVLDYGGVISKPQHSDNVNNMLRILDLDDNDFMKTYQSKRDNYDSGQITGKEYWQGILQHFGIEPNDFKIKDLIQQDVKSWTQINGSMIKFIKESKEKLHKLAIISNMIRDTLAHMKEHFQWLELFDELIFSCDIGKNKPDPGIYEVCIRKIEVPPEECLFVDDSIENVQGAMKSGMNVIHFKSCFQFCKEIDRNFYFSR